MQPCVLTLLLLALLSGRVPALYFHIGELEKKCFIEEIPDETMIIGERLTLAASGGKFRGARKVYKRRERVVNHVEHGGSDRCPSAG